MVQPWIIEFNGTTVDHRVSMVQPWIIEFNGTTVDHRVSMVQPWIIEFNGTTVDHRVQWYLLQVQQNLIKSSIPIHFLLGKKYL